MEIEDLELQNETVQKKPWRALVAYWILGLCNNYGYVVMLSAANDILHKETVQLNKIIITNGTINPGRECNYISTGAILLADIIPSLIVKMLSPFLPFHVHVRVGTCILLASAGYILVAFSKHQWTSILGVVLTSLCSGLGETTFLQYSSFFDKNVISTWSSGTGGAGLVGTLSYVALYALGLKTAMLIMLVVPITMAISFWIVLPSPIQTPVSLEDPLPVKILSLKKKLLLLPDLAKYILPLVLEYFLEYFINQGMYELINFDNTFLTKPEQYRWLQVSYQIGVFISRSSVNIFHIKKVWLIPLIQIINVIIFTTEAIYCYLPNVWILLLVAFWEGLLGGGVYVNTFYNISAETTVLHKQFSLGMVSFSDSVGITLAGALSLLVHNRICALDKPKRKNIFLMLKQST